MLTRDNIACLHALHDLRHKILSTFLSFDLSFFLMFVFFAVSHPFVLFCLFVLFVKDFKKMTEFWELRELTCFADALENLYQFEICWWFNFRYNPQYEMGKCIFFFNHMLISTTIIFLILLLCLFHKRIIKNVTIIVNMNKAFLRKILLKNILQILVSFLRTALIFPSYELSLFCFQFM